MTDMQLLEYQTKLETRFDILLAESDQAFNSVIKAERYSLLDGGKRIRPILLLEFYKLCGKDDDCAYNFACAVEMIHTYSLIHDDLPCMDDDDLRRGKPSCHKKFGEPLALLAGDGLLTEAFGVAAKTMGVSYDLVAKALAYLSSCAGSCGMIGGQVMDIEDNADKTAEYLLEMYRLKTGALIRTAAVCGCILAGADDDKIKAAEIYAEKLGLAFQIIDDLLDIESDSAVLGKPVGSDAKNGKNTVASMLGINKARELSNTLTKEALAQLDKFNGDTEFLKEFSMYLLNRKK